MDVYKSPVGQPKLKFKDISFEFTPDPDNRWVRLADLVPWEELPRKDRLVKPVGTLSEGTRSVFSCVIIEVA